MTLVNSCARCVVQISIFSVSVNFFRFRARHDNFRFVADKRSVEFSSWRVQTGSQCLKNGVVARLCFLRKLYVRMQNKLKPYIQDVSFTELFFNLMALFIIRRLVKRDGFEAMLLK